MVGGRYHPFHKSLPRFAIASLMALGFGGGAVLVDPKVGPFAGG